MSIYNAYKEGYSSREVIFGNSIVYVSFLTLNSCIDFQEFCYLATLEYVWDRKVGMHSCIQKTFQILI